MKTKQLLELLQKRTLVATCLMCHGEGNLGGNTCPKCRGKGRYIFHMEDLFAHDYSDLILCKICMTENA
jgi:DnaJ-class molecular chaperone